MKHIIIDDSGRLTIAEGETRHCDGEFQEVFEIDIPECPKEYVIKVQDECRPFIECSGCYMKSGGLRTLPQVAYCGFSCAVPPGYTFKRVEDVLEDL